LELFKTDLLSSDYCKLLEKVVDVLLLEPDCHLIDDFVDFEEVVCRERPELL
jgi:hypothetical protein